jgi:AraC-like DNA-binding protein
MLSCMMESDEPGHPAFTRQERHEIVIRQFQAIVEDNLASPLRMAAVSRQIGVSSRTLRLVSRLCLGVSPTQYVLGRRMNAAHQILRGGSCTVTDAATEFGFWELGRFSRSYREIYGESPSATLKLRSLAGTYPPQHAESRPEQ